MSGDAAGNGLDATLKDFAPGQRLFARYTLLKTLGRGGMGIVWLAHDEELERDVALKFLPDLIIHDRALLGDLKRETRRSLELTHKNIVRIYDFVHNETSGCISMEYIDGDTLSNLRADKPRKVFEPDELAEWVSQLCDALDYAHNHARVVHRDLKPTNLLVNRRGDLKVSDFGIARSLSDSVSKLTRQRGKSGTLVYMSPQQLDGDQGTHLDDIYSLGASIYELLTSKPPFYSGNVDRQIRDKTPPRMAQRRNELEIRGGPIDAVWEEIVAACLQKDPARRPQNISEVARCLEVPTPKTRRATQLAKRSRRKSVTIAGATVLALLLIAASLWTYESVKRRQVPPKQVTPQPAAAGKPAEERMIFAPGMGALRINTVPPGATVTIGGLGAKQTPATFSANTGKYSMFIELDGYEPVAKEVEAKEGKLADLGLITLQRGKATIELITKPSGATIFQGEKAMGITPFRKDDFPAGTMTLLFVLDGYLPREFKAQVMSRESFKATIPLAKPLRQYKGTIRDTTPLTINLGPDLRTGTMTQGSSRGDTIVKFSGVWDGATLRAKTREVVSKPEDIIWAGESFTLRFSDDGKSAAYECNYGTEMFTANLSAP